MDQATIKTVSEKQRVLMLAALQDIKQAALDGKFAGTTHPGICNQLDKRMDSVLIFLRNGLFSSWPKFSGDSAYPVPAPTDLIGAIREARLSGAAHVIDRIESGYYEEATELAEVAYDYAPVWEGESLVLRVELLQHMIDELQASLR